MRRALTALVMALLMLVTVGVAFAQDAAEHLRGTVTKVTGTTITVQTTEGQTRTVTIDAKTMIMRGSAHFDDR